MGLGYNTNLPISITGGGGLDLPAGGVDGNLLVKSGLGIAHSTGVLWTGSGELSLGSMIVSKNQETGYQLRFIGNLNGNANIANPIWTLGRLVEGGVVNKSVFRFVFSSDSSAERSVFEVEDTGTVASVSDGTRRSHFEAFLNNGDTEPIFRLSSSVGGNSQMGLQFGPGGNLPTDIEIARWADSALYFALGGTIKFFLYPDAFVVQPGVDFVMQNTTGTTSGLVLKEKDSNGDKFIRLVAPAAVPTSYTWFLPAYAPASSSFLKAKSSTETVWETPVNMVGGADYGIMGFSSTNTMHRTDGLDERVVIRSVGGVYQFLFTDGNFGGTPVASAIDRTGMTFGTVSATPGGIAFGTSRRYTTNFATISGTEVITLGGDGAAGSVLTTDGSGNWTMQPASGGSKDSVIITDATAPSKASSFSNVMVFDTTNAGFGDFVVDHSATNGTTITVPRTGRYRIDLNVVTAAASQVCIHAGATVNNNIDNAASTLKAVTFASGAICHSLQATVDLTAGQIVWFSNSGALTSNSSYFGIARASVAEL